MPHSHSIAVIAEKPSVARDIARVVGADIRGNGFFHGNGWIVTWALGHLVTLAQPHEIKASWKKWRRSELPMLPSAWPLVVLEKTRNQFETVRRILTSDKVGRIVCATDAGREGELIFRLIFEVSRSTKPVDRLWISSLTPQAIEKGFRSLKEGKTLDSLADAARARAQADWLVGMNLSRALTLAQSAGQGDLLTIGRVQTPTLKMIVDRELSIRDFVPEPYLEVAANFRQPTDENSGYRGHWFQGKKPTTEARRLPANGDEARAITERIEGATGRIEKKTSRQRRMPPPLLYDLTELQRHANRLFGFSAKKTLTIAQSLYETHKVISYPRTDSRHLSRDIAQTLPKIVDQISGPYTALLAPGTGAKKLGARFVNDAKVSDHHAMIPNGATSTRLSADEGKIFDLICRRLLSAFHLEHRWSTTEIITRVDVEGQTEPDRFVSKGSTVDVVGWKALDLKTRAKAKADDDDAQQLPSTLAVDGIVRVVDTEILSKKTRPPKRHTEATLLTAMESAGSQLDDKILSEAMREKGLGTPATRADIIENLLRREYIERHKKNLHATDRGIRLIKVAHPDCTSPQLTGEWESQLRRIERGQHNYTAFMTDIEAFVRRLVGEILAAKPVKETHEDSPRQKQLIDTGHNTDNNDQRLRRLPTGPEHLGDLLRSTFGHGQFRPLQQEVCRSVTEGKDALLVMPTGAGKSLCYQLPGLARGGTTLVVSPLIALMEDQVQALTSLGLRADRIHSGRARHASRDVAARYLDGQLDFLFIAPERLAVPGFPELLAKRPPVLIAIDEAHCISHWGHDFRPDYRMLGERLPLLRPAPVIALTATATPMVQSDIVEQLNIPSATRFIHGFRRTNIAIEVVHATPSTRREIAARVLEDPERRPAIVYAPTRKEADALGKELGSIFPAAAYHAGMTGAARDRIQTGFLEGAYEVIVATIAFGMGIDKSNVRTVIHTGLPGSVEGYYQEIGRAGRDGKPSRAILLYSWADRHTHEFFFNRDYPEPQVLETIFRILNEKKQTKKAVFLKTPLVEDIFDAALEKLWIHGGALIDPEENITRASNDWKAGYRAQRQHRQNQLERITSFADGRSCRMLELVRHFGDRKDSGKPCGICDFCASDTCLVNHFRPPNPTERAVLSAVIAELRNRDGLSTGQLYKKAGEGARLERRTFEDLLGGLVRSKLLDISADSFDKDGRTIRFQRAWLTADAHIGGRNAVDRVEIIEAIIGTKKPKTKRTKRATAKKRAPVMDVVLDGSEMALAEQLREWRLKEARKRRMPAFRVFNDRTIEAICRAKPIDEEELLGIPGLGPAKVRKYGPAIFEMIKKLG